MPHQDYKVQLWNNDIQAFQGINFDMFEQKHWSVEGKAVTDFEANFVVNFLPDEVAVVKMVLAPFVEKKQSLAELQHKGKQLDIQGFSEQGEVMFQYKNEAQNVT